MVVTWIGWWQWGWREKDGLETGPKGLAYGLDVGAVNKVHLKQSDCWALYVEVEHLEWWNFHWG